MKTVVSTTVLALAVLLFAAAVSAPILMTLEPCSPTPAHALSAQPPVVIETLDPSLERFNEMWRKEIARRFPNAIAVLVHGGDFVEGQWIVGTNIAKDRRVMPAADVVRHYQKLYPGRTLVLLACNPGHLKLGIPGVYYAKANVWCVPDRALTSEHFKVYLGDAGLRTDGSRAIGDARWEKDGNTVGNIFEFACD
jgi:hypothetical protein